MAGVYVSYPFCAQKCSYCNFGSGVLPLPLERDYLDALIGEIAAYTWSWTPETVYLGGGTPSRLEAGALERLLGTIPGRPWAEATIEAAPGGIAAEQARMWREAGINRVSLGVQSFVEAELRLTGRRHSADAVAREVETLREAGLSEINIDLIAGLAAQTEESWQTSLDWIERLAPPHVSVYMLEVDQDSRLGKEILAGGSRFGADRVPSEEDVAVFYETAIDELARIGLRRYEISNFARTGHESRHNLKYWRLEPYAGFGADAHGFDGVTRRRNIDDVRDYVRRWQQGQSPCVEETPAQPDQERFFVGLRLADGIRPRREDWVRYGEPIRRFLAEGLLERRGDMLRLSRQGVLLSNEVLQEFLLP